ITTRLIPGQLCYVKAKAVPVAASSSEIASARPTGPELRPRSFTALRIQHSSNDALDYQAVPKPIGFWDGQPCRPGSERAECPGHWAPEALSFLESDRLVRAAGCIACAVGMPRRARPDRPGPSIRQGNDLDAPQCRFHSELREIGEPQGKNRRRQEEGAGAVVVFKVDRIARQTRPGVQNQPKRPPARRALTRGRLEAIGVRFTPGGAIVCRDVVPT